MMLFSRERLEVAPGALHVPGWLTLDEQRHLVAECRAWAAGPVPIRHTKLPWGGVMSVQTVCIGWHWQPGPRRGSRRSPLLEFTEGGAAAAGFRGGRASRSVVTAVLRR
jgi:alkylated DNA repair dioxygenase AlkB